MHHRRLAREILRLCALAGFAWAAPVHAQSAAPPAQAGGLVIQAWPWRAADGRQVKVDYTVRLEGGSVAPGTLLAAYRQTRLGRSEGPPLAPVGYLTVVSAEGGVAVARAVPGRTPAGPHARNPVVQVGDLVRIDASPRALGEAGSSIDLAKLFPAGDAVLGPDAGRVLAELVKPAGTSPGAVAVVIYSGGAADRGAGAAFEQAAVLSRKVAELLKLDEANVYVATLPAGSSGPKAELRVLSSTGDPTRRTGAP
jgi:hypothetical protein